MPRDGRRLPGLAPVAGAVVVALAVLTVSCDPYIEGPLLNDDPSLRLPPGDVFPATSGLPVPTANTPISTGMAVVVCLSRPGLATIVGVHPVEGTANFEIQDFATRPNPSLVGEDHLGGEPGTLQDVGFDPDAHEVDAVCDGAGSGYEVAVQLARTGPGPAASHGFDIDWESEANSGTVRIPLSVVLCDAKKAWIPRCDLPGTDS
jgi:hypothetical protein